VLSASAVEVVLRSSAPGELRFGRLVDASQGGIAFRSEEGFTAGEALTIEVRELESGPLLPAAAVRAVAVEGLPGDQVVHCALEAPQPASWLEGLAI
jgi:hypothetical protein